MSFISITNHGPLITSTNYWSSELALTGKLFVSVNAGAIRVMLPPQHYPMLEDMRQGKVCVLSRGPWALLPLRSITGAMPLGYPHLDDATNAFLEARMPEAIEIMWDDGSDAPFALHLTPESFDLLPGEPPPGREWVLTVWTLKDGVPHKALERVCHWRRVERIPCLKAWG